MADSTVDLFKFVTIRATQTTAPADPSVIRDPRLGPPAPEGETPEVDADEANYAGSAAARAVYDLVKELGADAHTAPQVIEANRAVAQRILSRGPVETGTGLPHVDATTAALDEVSPASSADDLGAAITGRWPFPDEPATSWQAYVDRPPGAAGADRPSLEADQASLFDRLYLALVAKRDRAVSLEELIRGLRLLNLLRALHGSSAPEPADVAGLLAANPAVHRLITALVGYYRPFNPIRPVGIGDLLVVKQFLCRYEPGEVAHIENVLPDESKLRRHRSLNRTDDLVSVVEDEVSLTERELSTSQRFELKSETESTIQNDLSAEISGQVSGRYGVVEYSANAGVSYSTSRRDSRRGANNFAKDVVDRSLSRIQTSVREERTTRRLSETEELNRHELANSTGRNIAGIYRWVDKVYRAQVYNYGKRLMFEFVIPEPAAFVLSVFDHGRQQAERPDIPQRPVKPDLDISQISAATVDTYGRIYNLSGLDPEPPFEQTITQAIGLGGLEDQAASAHERLFDIPAGYAAVEATIDGRWDGQSKNEHGAGVSIGGKTEFQSDPPQGRIHMDFATRTPTFDPPLVGSVAAVVFVYRVRAFAFSVALKVRRTPQRLREWQLSVYESIMDAYDEAHSEYVSALGEYESQLQGYRISQGVLIRGRNPRINQEVIRTELRKSCLSMIALQFDADGSDDVVFDAMRSRKEFLPVESVITTETETVTTTTPSPGTTVTVTTTSTKKEPSTVRTAIEVPAIDVPEAVDDGRTVQFLEQAFEWQQLNYVLYPYFWGRIPGKWYDAQRYYDEVDPLYAKFLQAGAARVLVSVRPGFEAAVQHYLSTREPWNGGPVPDIDDPLYLAVHAELRDQQDDLNNATPYGDAWTVVVPTPIVWLQPDGVLPEFDCGAAPGVAHSTTGFWTGTAHQATLSTLASDQQEWTDWPSAAQWDVPVPDWATEADVTFTLNPGVVDGDVWGELRADLGGIVTGPSMFDVNYEADVGGHPEQAVMIVGASVEIPAALRGEVVPVRLQGRMLDPPEHPGRLEANRGCHVSGQVHFKRHPLP